MTRREAIASAEAALMKAALAFAYQWGRDQTVHPRLYWLELHLDTWRELARAALAYSEALDRNLPIGKGVPTQRETRKKRRLTTAAPTATTTGGAGASPTTKGQ